MILSADPQANYRAHAPAIREAIERVLASGHYILGAEGAAFESEFAAFQGGGEVVGVANGTEALELALRALEVGPGDAVATVANTVTATVAAIQQTGARPVFVEIGPATMVMSSAALAATLRRERVKAVVPVHLYGQPAPMPEIMALATEHGTRVVEDCAQAHGARVAGRRVGRWGDLGAFSFYPTKNLGALGDGGAVVTGDAALAERVRLLRQYGWRQRYVADLPGRNSRLDELQAAVLRAKLPHLEAENARRRRFAARYAAHLATAPGLTLPVEPDGTESVYHQYSMRTPRRDELRAYLLEQGITAGVLYPVPLHRQPAYEDPVVRLPVTEEACAHVLCLPVHPQLTATDIDRVADAVLAFLRS